MDDRRLLSAILREDFGTFVAKVFKTVVPERPYQHNWHINAVTFRLMRVLDRETRRLIITQPPRSLKSICASVAFPAWILGKQPGKRLACVSYSDKLAATFARQFRAVVTSDWYSSLFPTMRLAKDTEIESETTQGGGRFVVSVGGSFTGRGAEFIIIDDPMKAEDALSDKARHSLIEWYETTLVSRLNDKQHDAIILVNQRLHEDDLAGRLLRTGGWDHLDLPAIAETDRQILVGPNAFHIWRSGEALHPEREPHEALEKIKADMGSLAFSAQYLQRPIPAQGNLIRRDWIRWYEHAPTPGPGALVVQSWDVASTVAATSDWSVCTTWLALQRSYCLLDTWRGKLEFPQLKQKLIELARQYSPSHVLIESAGPGLHLIQEFRTNPVSGVPVPIGVDPKGDKRGRMEAQCARFEAGQVHFPERSSWLAACLDEILGFPNTRHDDQLDSISQFLNWAEIRRARYAHRPIGLPQYREL